MIQVTTVLIDRDKKILAEVGDPTAIHTKPGKSKDTAGLSRTQLGSLFPSVRLVQPPTTLQTPPNFFWDSSFLIQN